MSTYKQKPKRKKITRKIGKLVVVSALMAPVVSAPFGPGGVLDSYTAHANNLVDVDVLQNTSMSANLIDNGEGVPYQIELGMTGSGLVNASLVGTDMQAIFYSEELAPLWRPGSEASIEVAILPIILDRDLPTLYGALGGLLSQLNTAVGNLTSSVIGKKES